MQLLIAQTCLCVCMCINKNCAYAVWAQKSSRNFFELCNFPWQNLSLAKTKPQKVLQLSDTLSDATTDALSGSLSDEFVCLSCAGSFQFNQLDVVALRLFAVVCGCGCTCVCACECFSLCVCECSCVCAKCICWGLQMQKRHNSTCSDLTKLLVTIRF